ncbi:hypothetical protein PtA15_6A471 [Puccinia triticina]|uniref:Uncharacterized protein n=1 Tax=Puccinia triticina TaxID=208348 RepID=A0ABY7CSY9_9BASI|nr:uncharacterized protein PtA15_6A471 [Puccinia triticina]WAQ85842.1 hypothetical protein PtA15_6A471 [Puccinia triticina]
MMKKLIHLPHECPNRLGYIPLRCDDPNVLLEKERENQCKFDPCGCSNCNPDQHSVIVQNLKNLTVNNITGFLECPVDLPSHLDENSSSVALLDPTTATCPVTEMIRLSSTKNKLVPGLEAFATHLFERLREFFQSKYNEEDCYFAPEEVFSIRDARAAVLATEKGFQKDRLEVIVGNLIPSQIEFLHVCIEEYRGTNAYKEYTRLQSTNKSKKSKQQSLILSNQVSNSVQHLDPLLFESSLSALQQAPRKTKRQQAAEEIKKRTAAKREVKKAQNAIDEKKKREEAIKKANLRAKKKEEEDKAKEERNHRSAKRKSNKDANEAHQAKRSRRTQQDLQEFHLSTT